MLTAEQVQSYNDNGFLIVRQALDAETLDGLRRAADTFLERSRQTPPEGDTVFDVASEHSAQTPKLNRVNHPVAESEVFANVALGNRVVDIVCSLLGDHVKFHHSKLNMKTGGGGSEIGWHQDFAFFPHTNSDLLACGIALDASDTDNGCLMVVPGSHRWALMDHRDADGQFVGKIINTDQDFESQAVPVELQAGDMSIHHVMILHGSKQNDSARSRRLFISQYAAADAVPLDYRPPANVYSDKVLRGGPVTHARLAGPVTWPLRGSIETNSSIFKRQSIAAGVDS